MVPSQDLVPPPIVVLASFLPDQRDGAVSLGLLANYTPRIDFDATAC